MGLGHSLEPATFFLSNAPETTSLETLVRRHAVRYWVERGFQDAKTSLGMADYQARGWGAWHHHIAMVMLGPGNYFEIAKQQLAPDFERVSLPAEDISRKPFTSVNGIGHLLRPNSVLRVSFGNSQRIGTIIVRRGNDHGNVRLQAGNPDRNLLTVSPGLGGAFGQHQSGDLADSFAGVPLESLKDRDRKPVGRKKNDVRKSLLAEMIQAQTSVRLDWTQRTA